MKKVLLFIGTWTLFSIGYGQYSTPKTGVNWNMDSLVARSGGVVVSTAEGYRIKADLTIDSSDVLSILEDTKITLDSMVLFTVSKSSFIVNPPTSVLFTATDTTKNFKGFRFADTPDASIKKATIEFGGGIRVSAADVLFDNCVFRKNSKSYTSGAIDITSGNPVIINSLFHHNERAAISSGANLPAAPIIRNNTIYSNVTDNSNRPQINLGPSGPNDTTIIVGNTITGEFPVSGGISFSSLLGTPGNAIIDSNIIRGNRYGITSTGANLFTKIRYNIIEDNNIQNNPALGGSGISFQSAGGNNNSIVAHNEIRRNLWGITIIGQATPNLGNNTPQSPGFNIIENNMNTQLGDLFNNTPLDIYAMNNCWGGTIDSVDIEELISHDVDDTALGHVYFMPAWDCYNTLGIEDGQMVDAGALFPNPASDVVYLASGNNESHLDASIVTVTGSIISQKRYQSVAGQIQIPVNELKPGVYFIQVINGGKDSKTHRLLINR
jgi:hypothetical protein